MHAEPGAEFFLFFGALPWGGWLFSQCPGPGPPSRTPAKAPAGKIHEKFSGFRFILSCPEGLPKGNSSGYILEWLSPPLGEGGLPGWKFLSDDLSDFFSG